MINKALKRLKVSVSKLENYTFHSPFKKYLSINRQLIDEIINDNKYAQYSLMDTELINTANDIIKVMAQSNELLGLVIKDISVIDKSDLIKSIVKYLKTEEV